MEIELDLSGTGTPGLVTPEDNEDSAVYDKDMKSLKTYVDSLPYKCETVPEMHANLQWIVGRLLVCVKSKDWAGVPSWDALIHSWLMLQYPVPKAMRVKLVKLYYELLLIPGMEPRLVRGWADMLVKLTSNKGPGSRKKLYLSDIQLQWQPLWTLMCRELFPKKRALDSTRNMVNILLYVAEKCKIYFPPSEIEPMLNTFLPLLTRDTYLTIVHVLASFLPLKSCHLYVPFLFKLWESLNSHVVDERMLEIMGDLAVEHVTGKSEDDGEGAKWSDVGIFTQEQWTMLVGKCLGSFNVPVGATRGASTTGTHADVLADSQSLQIKKNTNRFNHLAQLFVYSISVDGPSRELYKEDDKDAMADIGQQRYLAGSRALDSLERLITSTETFFHPSNAGPWTLNLTTFLHRVASEFSRRWKEEEQPTCTTPITYRLTPSIKRNFVLVMRTPALLSMFSKDSVSTSFAQGALRAMAILEPSLIMPAILERAYSGLESVNETHRTTAVLSTLSGVALPLVSEKMWLGGQKHLLPLLELCIPGIDLNDPIKTVCTTMFIVAALQNVKIDDLTQKGTTSALLTASADMGDIVMTAADEMLPAGTEVPDQTLDRNEERALVRDSTAGFADWVVSFFRRVFALYENLPEEGGKRNTTGGKQEENAIKSIKNTLDVICLHLSDPLFDLVLNLTYDYAISNAKSNAVRAFGGLIGCLARVKPQKTIDKFLPHCISQIEIELRHGASSIRTTSTHDAVPSDTTLHWNMSILRGCVGYGRSTLLQYKNEIINLVSLLVEKTLGERGYTSAGRLIMRILNTVTGIYPINSRFVNSDEWDNPDFDNNDNFVHWGKLYEAKDVKVDWHTPSDDEVAFALDFFEFIVEPAMNKLDALLNQPKSTWDSVWRNDFCRYLHVVRSAWSGLPTIILEGKKDVVNPYVMEEYEIPELLITPLAVEAGYTLTDPGDARYQTFYAHRKRFGNILHQASVSLRDSGAEDHIDAVISVARSIGVYLLEYGIPRANFAALQKSYLVARDLQRLWVKSKLFSRLVFMKRAQLYHSTRVYLNSMFRTRDALDDDLLSDLIESSLSPYTRVRRHGQAILIDVCSHYVRSTRFSLPRLFDALGKGVDPDRMKGALYVLANKATVSYALGNLEYAGRYITTLLDCQHQEKPSIQKLVGNMMSDALGSLTQEAFSGHLYTMDTPGLDKAVEAALSDCGSSCDELLPQAMSKLPARIKRKALVYEKTLVSVLEVARSPTTHWRYVQAAARFLSHMIRRDIDPSPEVARFFVENVASDHPSLRYHSLRALVKLLRIIKIRTWSRNAREMWLESWKNPLSHYISIPDPKSFLDGLVQPLQGGGDRYFVDKMTTGFLVWGKEVKGYSSPDECTSPFTWDPECVATLEAICHVIDQETWLSRVASLWSQESNGAATNTTDVRPDHISFIKSIFKMFEDRHLDRALEIIEPLWQDGDRFKQRAAAEFLQGILRGSKHWPTRAASKIWSWLAPRLPQILSMITPDTVQIWESVYSFQLKNWDPRRNQPIVDFILSLPLEFTGGSPFLMSKSIGLVGILAETLGPRFEPLSDRYARLLFDHADTGYAEIRSHIAADLDAIVKIQWHPSYHNVGELLKAISTSVDPLQIRKVPHRDRIHEFVRHFPQWKIERLPPPNQAQSQYDKVGLTLLQIIWSGAHGPFAPAIFPYSAPLLPVFLEMAELNDSSDLQLYSTAVLYVLSAVVPPPEFVETVAAAFTKAIVSSTSWRVRLNALPTLVVFWYRNLTSFSQDSVSKMMDVLLQCLQDENLEVREMAAKTVSSVLRSSQRHRILPLKDKFVTAVRRTKLPSRQTPEYAGQLRKLHAAILGVVALIDAYPYTVMPWMPSLCEVLAPHATDPPPIAQTIRQCAANFKKTHQDTWHIDQYQFNDDQLQALSTMVSGTSYYA